MEVVTPEPGHYEEWIAFLEKLEEPAFLKDNVEFEIGKEPDNLELWKAYLQFLKSSEDLEVLNVYSRCCRVFPENAQLRKEYLEEIRSFGTSEDVTGFWIDAVLFECKFGDSETATTFLTEAMEKFKV